MRNGKEQSRPTKAIRSVVEVMDEALMQEGWTREQLDAQRRTGDIIAELMAEGYSGENLDAELQRRLLQEGHVKVNANGTTTGENRMAESNRRTETSVRKTA